MIISAAKKSHIEFLFYSMDRILLLWSITFLILFSTSHSQKRFLHEGIKFERISAKNGLSSNTIFGISEDSKGFLWIATGNGLNRFDGYSAKVYTHIPEDSNSLSDNRILTTLADADGSLWVGTFQGGLNKYDPNSKKFIRYNDSITGEHSLQSDRIFGLFRDSKGVLWIGTSSGLFTYDKSRDSFSKKNSQIFSVTKNISVRCIKEDYEHSLWIGTSEGLFRIDESRKKVDCFIHNGTPKSISNDVINSITFDKNNNIYIATEEGVNIFNVKTKSFSCLKSNGTNNSIVNNKINAVLYDQSGYLWIGTKRGLDIYDPEKKEFQHFIYSPENSNSISFNFINNIFEDKAGNIWISTFSGGLNKYIKKLPNIITFPSEYFSLNNRPNRVISAIEIEPNKLLLGTNSGLGILELSNNQFKPLSLLISPLPQLSSIVSFTRDPQGSFWFGTLETGLGKVNLQQSSLRIYTPEDNSNISDENINAVTHDHDGILWVGLLSGGIRKYNKVSDTFEALSHKPGDTTSLSSNRVRLLFVDSKNNLWVGTDDGLNLLNRNTSKFKRFRHVVGDPNTISGNIISCITEDQNGFIWIGTLSNGLERFDPSTGRFTHVCNQFSSLSTQIKGLLVDNQNCLWIATINGLFRYDIRNNLLSVFDENDGLMSNDFFEATQYKMKNGKLIFFNSNGFNIIDPINIFEKNVDHQIVLTDFKVFGKSKEFDKDISDKTEITLDYTENYFTIEFASLDLKNSSKINYSYKMEGVDEEWIDCGNRRYAGYMNLKGDDYFFKIRASRDDGSWYEMRIPLKISIASPPWERWYAYIVYGLLAFSFVSVTVKIRTRIQNQNIRLLQERQKILAESKQMLTNLIRRFTQLQEEERSYISRELHDGINQTIASIKLGVDRVRLDKKTPPSIVSELNETENHLRAIISEIRNISQNIRPSILDDFGILSAVENLCREYEMKTGIRVDVENENFDVRLGYEIESNLYRMVQESLNNVRKHSEATRIRIIFAKNDSHFTISIRDNGKGFNTEKIFTPEFAVEHFGLNNIKKRAELIGATFAISSVKETGSELIIKLPI